MSDFSLEDLEKYSARNWVVSSPFGKYNGVVIMDKAVSINWMVKRFPGWRVMALFDKDRDRCEEKVRAAYRKRVGEGVDEGETGA